MTTHLTQLPISRHALGLARSALTALTLLSATLSAFAAPAPDYHAWAPTPPMGWNSWDAFGTTLTETQAKAQADVHGRQTPPARLEILYRGHPVV